MVQNFSLENKASNDVEVLKRQIRNLEEKLKKQKLVAEKPYETEYKPSGKVFYFIYIKYLSHFLNQII
jgi:hypothetical protein